jgi:hypothetical protein
MRYPALAVGVLLACGACQQSALVLTEQSDAGAPTRDDLATTPPPPPLDLASSPPVDLASSPPIDLASSPPIDLAPPPPVDLAQPPPDLTPPSISSAPCLTGGSVIYFDGDPGDYIHPGKETIQVSTWTARNAGTPNTFWYGWDDSINLGIWWSFAFSAASLGQPLAVGRYDGAQRYPFQSPGHPGFDISGSGRGCNMEGGWFEIHELVGGPNNGTFTRLTATFEQHCENFAPALRGCIHFEH